MGALPTIDWLKTDGMTSVITANTSRMALRLAFLWLNFCTAVTDAADRHREPEHEQ